MSEIFQRAPTQIVADICVYCFLLNFEGVGLSGESRL